VSGRSDRLRPASLRRQARLESPNRPDARAAERQRATCTCAAGGVTYYQLRDRGGMDKEGVQGGPETEDVAGPVRGKARERERVPCAKRREPRSPASAMRFVGASSIPDLVTARERFASAGAYDRAMSRKWAQP